MTEDVNERNAFFDAWEKNQAGQKLNTLEKQIIRTIKNHPEFAYAVTDRGRFAEHQFLNNETNPFAHMSMHVMVGEMISDNTPNGIRSTYDSAVRNFGNKHDVQHRFIEALFDWYVDAQADQSGQKDQNFLEHLQKYLMR